MLNFNTIPYVTMGGVEAQGFAVLAFCVISAHAGNCSLVRHGPSECWESYGGSLSSVDTYNPETSLKSTQQCLRICAVIAASSPSVLCMPTAARLVGKRLHKRKCVRCAIPNRDTWRVARLIHTAPRLARKQGATQRKCTSEPDPTRVCLYCKKRRQTADCRYYCSPDCQSKADNAAPTLLEIPPNHVDYKSVEQQFQSAWRNTTKTIPAVQHIYKVVVHPSVVQRYKQYRSRVEARGKFSGKKGFNGKTMSEGNEHRRWHGTRRQCNLGEPGNFSLCQASNCSLCRIIQSNYNIQILIAKGSWERFGHGIYTSSTAAKSDVYASNAVASPLKALLLNHVVVGRGYKLTTNQTNLQGPPSGYDSVLGEISPGMLTDDELVVYDNDAICPAYLLMYSA